MKVISSKRVTIRKAHNCWGCTEIFTPPKEMNVVTCADRGKIYSVYWCDRCQKILEDAPFSDETPAYGELIEYQWRE